MANSYIPLSQQWDPNQFNLRHLQLEHDLDYNNLSVPGRRQLQPQQGQVNFSALQYSQSQIPSPPHSSSSLHGAFTMPTNHQSSQSSPQHGNNQHDYVRNGYTKQQPATHVPPSNSYPTTFNFSSTSRATSSTMNLDALKTSNVSSTFLTPHSSDTQQRSYYLPSSTSKESIPQAKRPRSAAYDHEPNPEDADLDSEPSPADQKDNTNKSKL